MLFREIITVYCEDHTEHINTLCGRNAVFQNVQASVRSRDSVVSITTGYGLDDRGGLEFVFR
jgi:hypothetical protein